MKQRPERAAAFLLYLQMTLPYEKAFSYHFISLPIERLQKGKTVAAINTRREKYFICKDR